MQGYVSEVGRRPANGTLAQATAAATPISITAAQAIVLPTKNVIRAGTLECYITVEGTATSRMRFDGVAPTAAIGHALAAPTATGPVTFVLRGEEVIVNFRIIGTAAGNTITYYFMVADSR